MSRPWLRKIRNECSTFDWAALFTVEESLHPLSGLLTFQTQFQPINFYLCSMMRDQSAKVAVELGVPVRVITEVVKLFEGGATIPFVARYRKELTGGLDEVQLHEIGSAIQRQKELEARRDFILRTMEDQGVLTAALKSSVSAAPDLHTLEDLYLPFKKKRKTRASIAKDLGLEPLAALITNQGKGTPNQLARQFLSKKVGTVDDALRGACDIISEQISELPWVRQMLRGDYLRYAVIQSTVVKAKEKVAGNYKDYFSVSEKIARCPSHRLLAIFRGEKEGYLRVKIAIDVERSLSNIQRKLIRKHTPFTTLLSSTLNDSFKRLIAPSLENETRKCYKDKADRVAIDVFTKNLRQLLLAPPLGERNTLALDPGFRTGCKLVVLNRNGELTYHSTIFPPSSTK